jgi:hypothetical protein
MCITTEPSLIELMSFDVLIESKFQQLVMKIDWLDLALGDGCTDLRWRRTAGNNVDMLFPHIDLRENHVEVSR